MSSAYSRMVKASGVSNFLVRSTQSAFGTVANVVQYYAKGLVIFNDGSRWIFNYNTLYPTFYCVQRADGKEITTINQQVLRVK